MKRPYRNLILLSLLTFGLSTVLPAQPPLPLQHHIDLGLGANHLRFIDEAFVNRQLKFAGTPVFFGLAYERTSQTAFFRSALRAGFGSVSSRPDNLEAKAGHFELGLSYARQIREYTLAGTQNTWQLGGQLSSSNYGLGELRRIENITVCFYHTANLLVRHATRFDDANSIQLALALPLVGFVKRAAYDGGANQQLERDGEAGVAHLLFRGSRFSVLNPLRFPRLSLQYVRQFRPKTALLVTYRFEYLANSDIKPIRLYSNSLMAGLRFSFNTPAK